MKQTNDSDFVLDDITHRDIQLGKSLIAVILAALRYEMTELRNSATIPESQEKFDELDKEIARVQIMHARTTTMFMENITSAGLKGKDFAWQYTEAQNISYEFPRKHLSSIVRRCLSLANKTRIVVSLKGLSISIRGIAKEDLDLLQAWCPDVYVE